MSVAHRAVDNGISADMAPASRHHHSAPAWFVLAPVWWGIRNRMRRSSRRERWQVVQALVIGAAIWSVIGVGARGMLERFAQYPELATTLTLKMLGVILAAGFGITLVATTVAALSVFYGDDDTPLLLIAPLDWLQLYAAQLARVVVHGSWALVLIFTPVLYAVGVSLHAGWRFGLVALLGAPLFLVCVGALGAILALGLACTGHVRRVRAMPAVVGVIAAGGTALFLRIASPTQVLRTNYATAIALVDTLGTPTAPWLPSEWWARALVHAGHGIDWYALGAMLGAALLTATLSAALFGARYRATLGRVRSADDQHRADSLGSRIAEWLELRVGPAAAQVAVKDVRRVLRTTADWSHVLLAGVGLLIYFYNLAILPVGGRDPVLRLFAQLIALLHFGVVGLLLASLAAHYLIPAVSLEAPALTLLRLLPTAPRTLLAVKLWLGWLVFAPVAAGITLSGHLVLHTPLSFALLETALAVLTTMAIVALAVWFGARYPVFHAKSTAEIASSLGATLFIVTAFGLALADLALAAPYALTVLGQHHVLPARLVHLLVWPAWLRAAGLLAAMGLPGGVIVWARRAAPRALERQLLATTGRSTTRTAKRSSAAAEPTLPPSPSAPAP